MYKQRTLVLKPADAKKKWHVVDASGKIVGRLATEIADLLRGKHNPLFTLNTDSGDFVVVINAEKIVFTGQKLEQKVYFTHSNFTGGIKSRTAREQLNRHPEMILLDAVKGMLPKTSLGRKQMTKLRVFVGPNHDHAAQNPVEYKL